VLGVLPKHSRTDALDKLRKKFEEKKLGFPGGFIYKVIKKEDVFDAGAYLESLAPEIRGVIRRVLIFGGVPEKESDVKSLWKLPKLGDDLKTLDTDLKKRVEEEYGKLISEGKWIGRMRGRKKSIGHQTHITLIGQGEVQNGYLRIPVKKGCNACIRNPDYYFRGGVTFTRVGYLRVRVAFPTVFDDKTPFLTSSIVSEKFLSGFFITNIKVPV